MDEPPVEPQATPPQHRWQPLSAIDRRVVGVLAEKAKTTPDIYPMSVNAISAGCNQKSNRAPLMQLEPADVEESLDRLRELGAVGMVEGYGRVQKYRHYLYDWLGVEKVELAVMTELLLRGDQTVGELRGRAARMEPIADLAALQPVLASLKSKRLVISLTPEGRGHVVTHALYKPHEIEALKARHQGAGDGAEQAGSSQPPPAASPRTSPPRTAPAADDRSNVIRQELATLREQVAQLQNELEEVRDTQSRTSAELRALRESLGG
jgi:uncharacterized protein YceH (UPF0502 family)